MDNNYVPIKEFCEKTGYSYSGVYNAVRLGRLPSKKILIGLKETTVIPRSELERILAQKKEGISE